MREIETDRLIVSVCSKTSFFDIRTKCKHLKKVPFKLKSNLDSNTREGENSLLPVEVVTKF